MDGYKSQGVRQAFWEVLIRTLRILRLPGCLFVSTHPCPSPASLPADRPIIQQREADRKAGRASQYCTDSSRYKCGRLYVRRPDSSLPMFRFEPLLFTQSILDVLVIVKIRAQLRLREAVGGPRRVLERGSGRCFTSLSRCPAELRGDVPQRAAGSPVRLAVPFPSATSFQDACLSTCFRGRSFL